MPMKPKKPCRHPGCPKLTDGIYCENHGALHCGDRTSSSVRGYDRLFWDEENWQALCKNCHDSKTMTEDRYQEYKY